MGKASRGKKVLINEDLGNQGRHEKELKSSQKPPSKFGLQKPASASKFIPVLIVLFVSFTVYFNSLSNGFVYDDLQTVLGNPWIKDIKHIPEIFSSNLWGFQGGKSNYYRPVASAFGTLLFIIYGTKPFGYHLFNILVHSGVSVLALLISSRLIADPPESGRVSFLSPALIAALLFAVHPIHTEAVAWSGGFTETSFAFFYLLSLYFYIRARDGQKKGYLFSVFFFSVSLLCKETALTLPLLIVVYDYALRGAEEVPLARLKRYFPFFAVTGIYLIVRSFVLGGFAPVQQHAELNIYQQLINVPPLFAKYLEKLVLPLNLNVYHIFHPIRSLLEMEAIIALFCAAAFILLAFWAWGKSKVVFFSLVLLIVPLLPAFYLQGLSSNVFTERYLYLPSFGFTLLPAILTARVLNKPGPRTVADAVLIIILCLFSFATIQRNAVWKNNYTLWSDTVKKSPDSPEVHIGLGIEYASQNLWDRAIAEYQTALRLNPNNEDAHTNIGDVYTSQGQLDRAIAEYQTALRLNPYSVRAHFKLGNAYASQNLWDRAIAEYQIALQLKPDFIEVRSNLGIAYASQGQLDRAIAEFQTALRLRPDYEGVHNNLGIAYASQGQLDKAIAEFQTALQLNPDFHEARQRLDDIVSKQH